MDCAVSGWTPDRMLERLGSDEALARELVALFLTEYGRLLDALRATADSGQADGVRTAAHALKGCVGNFTDSGAYSTAYEIERRGTNGQLEDVPALIAKVTGELDDMAARMRLYEAGM